MRTIILLAIVVVLELLAVGVIGAERHRIYKGGVHRKYNETWFILFSILMSLVSLGLYFAFVQADVLPGPISLEELSLTAKATIYALSSIGYGAILYGASIVGGNIQSMRLRKRISHIAIIDGDNVIKFKLIDKSPE